MVTDLAFFNSIQPPQTRIFKLPYIDTCNFSLAFPDSAAMTDLKRGSNKDDPFLSQYQPSELRITSEFLTTWLPFLSRDLCHNCSQILSRRIRSLHSELDGEAENLESNSRVVTSSSRNEAETRECCYGDFHKNSSGSAKDDDDDDDINSLGSWKDSANEWSEPISEVSGSGILGPSSHLEAAPSPRLSWADMAQEDELVEEEEQQDSIKQVVSVGALHGELRISDVVEKPQLSREERERIRFMNVRRKKDYLCFERIRGKLVNVVEGLELHMNIFSAAEQKRIVDYVNVIEEKGKKGELKARTYTAPRKWMKGKGRVTIQFGCCYNYATDKNGNPPGILQNETVDPIPHLFKVIIRRLVRWHVLPPTCVPDSCIVNIYDEGDCIPPHIDNHDFLRPFCTVSFVSECNIVFGSDLKAVDAGLFAGSFSISLPVGSVLVLNGNGADVAKHCVPSVPTKRISITFRKMDETKQPNDFVPEPDLQGIKPLPYEDDRMKRLNPPKSEPLMERPMVKENNRRGYAEGHSKTESRYSNWNRRGAANKRGAM